ncbi:MAG: carbon monoxide dehydrogenase subunit G [Dehalococcoidia bacterium]
MPLFKEAFTVGVAQQEVWEFLMDVERMAACIPGCEEVQAIDDTTFKTRIKVKVGPFSTTQTATMRLTEVDPPRHLASEGQGDDPRMGSKVNMKATLDLTPLGQSETRVDYTIDVKVLGRLGMLGEAVMRVKAREMSDQFASNLKSAIEQGR